MGADTALLAGTTGEYDKEDKEADEIWAKVDNFMDDRRRVRFCCMHCRGVAHSSVYPSL